ncbi:hypothetical protein [Parasphingorhabdus sp.]
MRFIIRTIAAGVVSMAARIIIKKIQDKNQPESANDSPVARSSL